MTGEAMGAPQQEASGAQPIGHVRFVAHRKAPDVEWAANVEIHNGAALYTSPRAAATAPAGGVTLRPTGDQLRAIAQSARTSASDPASPSELVLAGWNAALTTAARAAESAGGVTELPDDLRVPLDSLHADALYLASRVAQGTMSAVRLSQVIRERIDAAKAALTTAARAAEPKPAPGMAVQALAGEIIAALLADEKDGGYDLTGGLFGPAFSKLVRRWAAAEIAASPTPPTGTSKEGGEKP